MILVLCFLVYLNCFLTTQRCTHLVLMLLHNYSKKLYHLCLKYLSLSLVEGNIWEVSVPYL
jgi:hypothetical protein